MTIQDLYRKFDLFIDKNNGISSHPSFLMEEKDMFFNSYIESYIKTRISGMNIHGTGFQANQKRTDDLRTLVSTEEFSVTVYDQGITYNAGQIVYIREFSENKYKIGDFYISLVDLNSSNPLSSQLWEKISNGNSIYIKYPSNYYIGLGERVNIFVVDSNSGAEIISLSGSDVIESTIENIDTKLSNTLSEHRLFRMLAKPIRLYSNGNIYLYTDGNYGIRNYSMTYISIPEKIDYYKYAEFNNTATYNYGDRIRYSGQHYEYIGMDNAPAGQFNRSDWKEVSIDFMPEHTWDEIARGAVSMAMMNTSDDRYSIYTQETQMSE